MSTEITGEVAIKTLQDLIEKRTKELNNTPAFLEEERENLEIEISSYIKHLKWIKGGAAIDR